MAARAGGKLEQCWELRHGNPHWSLVLQLMMAFLVPVIYGLILYGAAFVMDLFLASLQLKQ